MDYAVPDILITSSASSDVSTTRQPESSIHEPPHPRRCTDWPVSSRRGVRGLGPDGATRARPTARRGRDQTRQDRTLNQTRRHRRSDPRRVSDDHLPAPGAIVEETERHDGADQRRGVLQALLAQLLVITIAYFGA